MISAEYFADSIATGANSTHVFRPDNKIPVSKVLSESPLTKLQSCCWNLQAGFCNTFQSDFDHIYDVWGPCFVLWSATGGHLKKNAKSFQRWKYCSLTITGWRRESSGALKTSRGLFWHIEFSLYLSKKMVYFICLADSRVYTFRETASLKSLICCWEAALNLL